MVEHLTNPSLHYDRHLNVKGLNCPLPILKAKLLLNKMHSGEVLFVEATDPHSDIDFQAYCASNASLDLLSSYETAEGVFCFYISLNSPVSHSHE